MSPSPEQILDQLRQHRPVKNAVVKRNVRIRWVTTIALVVVGFFGLFIGVTGTREFFPISGWIAFVVAAAGMLGLASGWMARRRHGFDAQWGFAPLGAKELLEFSEIANADPELGEIIDVWATRCLESGCNLRGRDLMLLRKKARDYLRKKGETLPSISPRV